MTGTSYPPYWRHNPSAWYVRLPGMVLALTGFAIATYLGLYQLGIVAHVWEPFFGNGSRAILRDSWIAHLLPVPDALLGATCYLFEAVAEGIGGRQRWRSLPWAVFTTGAVAAALGLSAGVLVLCQAFLFRAYCTLCLASAACSVALLFFVIPEVWAAVEYRRRVAEALACRS